MRPIDADALIVALKRKAPISDSMRVMWAECLQEVRFAPTIEPEPHWIPCSKRLPERGEDVLVTRDYDGREDNNKSCRYVEVASCYGEDEDITWNSFSDEYKMHPKNHHVIAWMPLPEPYQEEGE